MNAKQNGNTYYTSKEAKNYLNKSLIEDAKILKNSLNDIKEDNKNELCIK